MVPLGYLETDYSLFLGGRAAKLGLFRLDSNNLPKGDAEIDQCLAPIALEA